MAAAVLAPVGSAADPREIAADLADGRLDGSYSQADLQAYVQSAMVQGYGAPTLPPSGVAGEQSPPGAGGGESAPSGVAGEQSPQLSETGQVGTLPFTGVDLALLALGGGLLLLLGLGARRLGRQT